MKVPFIILFFSVIVGSSAGGDPRSVSLIQVRGIDEDRKAMHIREESVYSIVVYGAHDSHDYYRVLGLERPLKLEALTALLNAFYDEFPKRAETPDERLVPLPNILYASGGWNETKEDGRSLVKGLSEKHGVALYYFQITPEYSISRNKDSDQVPSYPEACIQYYQARLNVVRANLKTQREQGGADQPTTAVESRPVGKENRNPESKGRPQ